MVLSMISHSYKTPHSQGKTIYIIFPVVESVLSFHKGFLLVLLGIVPLEALDRKGKTGRQKAINKLERPSNVVFKKSLKKNNLKYMVQRK